MQTCSLCKNTCWSMRAGVCGYCGSMDTVEMTRGTFEYVNDEILDPDTVTPQILEEAVATYHQQRDEQNQSERASLMSVAERLRREKVRLRSAGEVQRAAQVAAGAQNALQSAEAVRRRENTRIGQARLHTLAQKQQKRQGLMLQT